MKRNGLYRNKTMNLLRAFCCVGLLALVHGPAFADDGIGYGKGKAVATAGASYYRSFVDSAADDGFGPALSIGYGITDQWAVEFLYTRYEFKNETPLSFSNVADVYKLGIVRTFDAHSLYQPYAVFDIGLADEINVNKFDEFRDVQLGAGGGLFRGLGANLSVRGDVRMAYSFEYREIKPFMTMGLSYQFPTP